ncbi:hypothetical protein PIB30_066826 [Stylosanthes scabra]|uniref:Terpene synthase metal-binding domain-containing protein n=1 Tax=Stylosanthes scabra TaxID=79078 RepID=A0ABU6XNW4_9FABA|nr:hypothetical protein [Stylosanthes scabra]
MKVVFNAIAELCAEIESLTTEGGKSSLPSKYVKQAYFKVAEAYLVEAKWCHESYIPTYDEYKTNGISAGYPLFTTAFIALGEFATKEILDWVSSYPKIIKAVSIIGRLTNDTASHKFEQQRKHVASAVECCMRQYGITQEEAYEFINNDINNCWKDINEEYLKLDYIPRPVLDCIVNLARISELLYASFEDKYTNCALLNDYIVALLLDPILI